MPDLVAIGQGLTALKTLTDLAGTMVGLRDSAKLLEASVKFNHQLIAIQQALMAAQSEQAVLVEAIQALEKENRRLKSWDDAAADYELKPVAEGVVAYMLKPHARGTEPPHWRCAQCYAGQKKSILQFVSSASGRWAYQCPSCSQVVRVGSRIVPRWLDLPRAS